MYLSGISGYPFGRDVIEWAVARVTEGMSCEAVKLLVLVQTG